MKIEFESENKHLLAMLNEMSEKITPAATSTALNRTATHAIKLARRQTAAEAAIPQKFITKRIKVKRGQKATARHHSTRIWVGTYSIPVQKLVPKPKLVKKTGQVQYKTLRNSPIDPIAFVAKGKKGVTAFSRKGFGRLPIKQKTLNIGPILTRKMWMNLGPETKQFYKKTFYAEIDGRTIVALRKRGLSAK